MSDLHNLQVLFARLVPRLIDQAFARGYEVTLGEVARTPEQAELNAELGSGTRNSLHIQRLAIDLNLFKLGALITDSEDYRFLGDFWKTCDPLCRWGGDFTSRPDGNHFSISYQGRA